MLRQFQDEIVRLRQELDTRKKNMAPMPNMQKMIVDGKEVYVPEGAEEKVVKEYVEVEKVEILVYRICCALRTPCLVLLSTAAALLQSRRYLLLFPQVVEKVVVEKTGIDDEDVRRLEERADAEKKIIEKKAKAQMKAIRASQVRMHFSKKSLFLRVFVAFFFDSSFLVRKR
jgi:hypothetical protein